MKTNTIVSKIFKVVALVSMTAMLANCAKENKTTPVAAVGTYQLVNNVCYQNVNGTLQPMPNNSYCSVQPGTYQMVNNVCYQLVNGNYVPQPNTSLCTMMNNGLNNGFNNGFNNGGMTTMVCHGPYTDGTRWVECGTQFNCSGYTLYNQSNQIVRCQ